MTSIEISESLREAYNKAVAHPLQSFEWGEFRKKTGITVIRQGSEHRGAITNAFSLTIHPIPKTPYTIGYLPKGAIPTPELLTELTEIGHNNNCIFIQLEPNIHNSKLGASKPSDTGEWKIGSWELRRSHHPLFTRYTFTLDLTKSEDELLALMHSKTRYNVRVAERKGVKVIEDNTKDAFAQYLRLTDETTTRQQFYAHTHKYHTLQWETLPHTYAANTLSSHLLIASFEKEPLVAWILFAFQDTLYYPYGASSSIHKDKMASNIMMWEAIKFGKSLGLKHFDMWGALGSDPDTRDPWYGFHRFKQNYGATHTEFVGSYDLVLNPSLYKLYQGADIARWALLRLKKRFSK
jgi:lipid II:glycine glycyltransferase (peptidoglycan interpeptide bridge formation enzyme)